MNRNLNIYKAKSPLFKTGLALYAIAKADPTNTAVLARSFDRQLMLRFGKVKKAIRQAVNTQDVFGLKPVVFSSPTVYATLPGPKAFAFNTTGGKVNSFIDWLKAQVDADILDIDFFQQSGSAVNKAWTDIYITDSYTRGVQRARLELKKAGYAVPAELADATGGIGASLSSPFHVDRLGALYTRTFNDLKGITDAMNNQISRVLTEGLMNGDSPYLISRKLTAVIDGSGKTLGITDTLGRFIPAERRAKMLARTEIIRAHHVATIQEYKNWGAEGVTVQAEWSTAGDSRVCNLCAPLQGKFYTLEAIQPMIPRHPNCFINGQVPIYTTNGWKKIRDIEIGDYVLTHKKRFQKVYALPRTKKQTPEVVKFTFKGGTTLTMTINHQVLKSNTGGTIGRWKEAGDFIIGENITILANKCKRCGNPIPYYNTYCSKRCNSLDITDKQWSNPEHRKNISKKNSASMLHQYKVGLRDKDTVTKAANEKTRQLVKEGKWILQQESVRESGRHLTNTKEHREASTKRMKENNPMYNMETRKKVQITLAKTLELYPEKRINARMAKHRKSGRKTYIETRMALLLDKMGVDYVFQYPILRYNTDFAIPTLKIVIECDGEYWHKDKEKDAIRQKNIENEGWFVLRYTGAKINQCLDEIENELARVVGNHTGEYNTTSLEIESIKKWKVTHPRTLFNLSVEQDESYMAKGIVVHNCRCLALPARKSDVGNKYVRKKPTPTT